MSDAASVQDALGDAGACPRFEWRGKWYTLGFPTDAAKARLEELVIQAETAAVRSLKGLVPDDEYQRKIDRLGRLNRGREYRTRSGSLWREYMVGESRDQGFLLYVLSLLHAHHPELTDADVAEMLDECGEFVTLAADRVVPGFFDFLAAAKVLPPELAAAAKAGAAAALRRLTPTATTG